MYMLIIVAMVASTTSNWSLEARPLLIQETFGTYEKCTKALEHQVQSLTTRRFFVSSNGCYQK